MCEEMGVWGCQCHCDCVCVCVCVCVCLSWEITQEKGAWMLYILHIEHTMWGRQ